MAREEGERFAKENGLLFMETSALKDVNITEVRVHSIATKLKAFHTTARVLYAKAEKGEINFENYLFGRIYAVSHLLIIPSGCASVLNTYLSKGINSSSENNRYKY